VAKTVCVPCTRQLCNRLERIYLELWNQYPQCAVLIYSLYFVWVGKVGNVCNGNAGESAIRNKGYDRWYSFFSTGKISNQE